MQEYQEYRVTLSSGQDTKIRKAQEANCGVIIRLSKDALHGDSKLLLTQTQINKIKKAKSGVQLQLSISQLNELKKKGGILPLLTLIPLIAGAIGAAGGLAGGVASAVTGARSNTEQARHNRAIEEQMKSGTGVISDTAAKIPIIGNVLAPILKKLGMGIANKLKNGECVCHKGVNIKMIGRGIYLEPEGSGVFLDSRRE